jgi:predicted dienelactone hydrolase
MESGLVMKRLIGVVAAVATLTAGQVTVAGRKVAVWKPAGAAGRGYPVILFSHGFGGINIQSRFLMEALAGAGYLVLAPNHADARPSRRAPEEPFRDYAAWSDATYHDRRADIEAVLDVVLRTGSFEGVRVDRERVGIAGHSLGGYTALGLAGAWPSWKDRRIKAVLAMSAYCGPYLAKGDLGHMNVPVMYQGGTRDYWVTPAIRRAGGAYERSSAPKYFVEFKGAGHLAWTNLNPRYQGVISKYAVAFFDRYLKGKREGLTELVKRPWREGVAEVRFTGR